MTEPVPSPLAAGQAALRRGDAAAARRALAPLVEGEAAGEPSGDVVEALARADYLDLDFPAAIEGWERAYGLHRAAGDGAGAVRVARTVAYMYGSVVGDWAVTRGWLARAQTLLGKRQREGEPDAADDAEAGWVALTVGMFEADRARKDEHFRRALTLARAAGDVGLEVLSLAYLGASVVHADRTEEGMLLLDESLAALAGHEVDDFSVLEEAFCQLFSACEHAHDVGRAEEWMRVGTALAERRRLPVVSAFCRTHYGGLLTTAGRWPEAEATLTEAIRLWGLGQRSGMRASALVRLADLRARQGRYEEAEQLLAGRDGDLEAARPLAAAQLARGDAALAGEVLARALAQLDPTSTAAAPLLALRVDVELAAGHVDEASATVDRLSAIADAHPGHHYLQAAAALARGRVCLAAGDGDPRGCLREALAGFDRAQMPVEVARSRLELANVLVDDSPEVALAEARAALEAFERLQAARDADAAAATLRGLGVARRRRPGGAPRRPARAAPPAGRRRPVPRRPPRSRPARPRSSTCSATACPTPRSRRGSSSAARRSSTTWATCWPSSGCAAGRRRRPTRPAWDPPPNRGPHRSAAGARGAPWPHEPHGGGHREDTHEMSKDYDAIVVGARCAGSPTAMLLARRGYRVLLVDRATFPSDTTSTHMVHAPGVAALRRWGLLDLVTAAGTPPVPGYDCDFGGVRITGSPQPADGVTTGYAPRRSVLDTLLVDAASVAGAEVREGFTMSTLVVEDGRVAGIRGHTADGTSVVEQARVVVGADGWNSRVARAVGRRSTTTGRCSSGAPTATGAACRSSAWRPTCAPTGASRPCPPTTG